MEQHICVEDNGPFFDHNDHQVLKKVFNPLAHRLLPRSAIGYQTKDLALIDLATRFRRILITSFIPVVLDFMGYGLRNSAVGGFFYWGNGNAS
jgi:hypothetical protein